MKHKLKKWHIALMSFLTLFIAVFASLFSLKADTVDEETGEVLTDNWEISTVFYDSTVDSGVTPLTEINWDASDGGYGEGTPRVITVQINYKNTSAVTTYEPGELIITIPNLAYSNSNKQETAYNAQWKTSITVGANDSTHVGYDWNFATATAPSTSQEIFKFTNVNTIEEKANFEGSIQIQYSITPAKESPERYLDKCVHSYKKDLKVNLKTPNTTIESNKINFSYIRTYLHPWTKVKYTLDKYASKISSYDGLGENPQDYYWVKYQFRIVRGAPYNSRNDYPNISVDYTNLYMVDTFPEGCIFFDEQGIELTLNENNQLILSGTQTELYDGNDKRQCHFFVGYPKSIYNENNENLNITNTAQLYGKYTSETDYEYLDDGSVSLNLSNYEFNYTGNLYGICKVTDHSTETTYYQSLINKSKENKTTWYLGPTARYTGTPLTVRIGDDLLFTTNSDGVSRKVSDDDYYFSSIQLLKLYNSNGIAISPTKYPIKLFVRYANSSEYIQYGENITSLSAINFTREDKVVGFYIQIENMRESLYSDSLNIQFSSYPYSCIKCTTIYSPQDPDSIAREGSLVNFNYINVYTVNENGELILQNEPELSNYSTEATQRDIATYDMETYNHYVQRSVSLMTWKYYTASQPGAGTYEKKTAGSITQNIKDEYFEGSFRIYGGTMQYESISTAVSHDEFFESYRENCEGLEFLYLEDILPEGLELISSKEEIINSLKLYGIIKSSKNNIFEYNKFYTLDGEKAFNSEEEAIEYTKQRTTIEIIKNYNNSNRTKLLITVDFSDNPLFLNYTCLTASYSYNYHLTYDSYLEYGDVYYNTVETWSNLSEKNKASASAIINSVVSTHQDVTTYVKTDQSNYSTGIVDASNNSEYEYKLRVRTGSADVTNLIIYTNIEEAQPERTRWKGDFIDINTSYAETKGYTVKTYYSENNKANKLYNEDGTLNSDWKEYIPDTPEIVANGLSITFNSQSQTENNCDYVIIYYEKDGKTYQTQKLTGTNIAGKTVTIPSTDFYLYWYTDGSACSYYGFSIDSIVPCYIENITDTTGSIPSYTVTELQDNNYPDSAFGSYTHGNYGNNIKKLWHYTYTGELEILQPFVQGTDKSKVKSLAFEYLDNEGNPAILPANSLTYVTIQMKSPDDENIKTLARMDCRTQWNAIDEFDQPVDFITGINSNVVKVALPNSVKTDDMPSVSLRFTKEIQGINSQFENMKLDKAAQQTFMIRLTNLTANDDGSYNQVTALLKSNQELIISQIPVGTYLLEELGDNYFDFVDFTDNNDPEIIINGVTFEQTDQGYVITVSEDLSETIEFNIKVTNEIEDDRFYEDKSSQENLFLKNKLEDNGMMGDDPQGH